MTDRQRHADNDTAPARPNNLEVEQEMASPPSDAGKPPRPATQPNEDDEAS